MRSLDLDLVTNRIKRVVKRFPPYRAIRARRQERNLLRWIRAPESAPPPPLFKQKVVREYGRRFEIPTLVETGTYIGQMVDAVMNDFRRVYSIELDPVLYKRAADQFRHQQHVVILYGNSGEVLRELLPRLKGPCLFWLDGHYSGGITARGPEDTPVTRELDCVLASDVAGHVILIDDARCFGQGAYPTLDAVRHQVRAKHRDADICVVDDIIRIVLKPDGVLL